jgi:pyruvate formate lyase activating enzyme
MMKDKKALIFDVQRYSVHDGPGIRTLIFFKGCPLRCRWCQNPESTGPEREIAFFKNKCIGCGECAKVCPNGAIIFEGDKRIIRALCDRCGKCTAVCYAEALVTVGKEYDVPGLLDIVERDRPFYSQSGGGVTVSGGEPTLQFGFLLEFLKASKAADLHTVMETSGACAWSKLEKLLPFLDLIYFDLKLIDAKEHKRNTGSSNRQILANARKLIESPMKVVFRVPLIPGITATEENLEDIVDLLNEFEQDHVHVLPYHKMGESKLERLDSPLRPLNLEPFSDEEIVQIKSLFEQAGIRAIIGGG